jgi:hypothetical protein
VLFESQIDYEFVNGDISTFLRYKYYARNYTYRIGVFDSIEFPDLTDNDSKKEFERVRGGLLLIGVPKDYNNRYFVLLQDDRLTFGDDAAPRQPQEQHLYEDRLPVRDAVRRADERDRRRAARPHHAGADRLPRHRSAAHRTCRGDHAIRKNRHRRLHVHEVRSRGAAALRLTSTSFVFSRLHVGSFLSRNMIEPPPVPRDRDGDGELDEVPEWEKYDVPQYELFRLGGREALKSISSNDTSIGTQEIHLTNELFVPIFRNRSYKVGPLYWNTLYGIGYVGVGAVGFKTGDLSDPVMDAGIGTESAITFGDYDVYLSILAAHTFEGPDSINRGTKVRFAIRTVR